MLIFFVCVYVETPRNPTVYVCCTCGCDMQKSLVFKERFFCFCVRHLSNNCFPGWRFDLNVLICRVRSIGETNVLITTRIHLAWRLSSSSRGNSSCDDFLAMYVVPANVTSAVARAVSWAQIRRAKLLGDFASAGSVEMKCEFDSDRTCVCPVGHQQQKRAHRYIGVPVVWCFFFSVFFFSFLVSLSVFLLHHLF